MPEMPSEPQNLPPWYRYVVVAGFVAGIVLGTWGFHKYVDPADTEIVNGHVTYIHVTWSTAFFHAIELFELHSPLMPGPLPWQLETGRAVATATTLLAAAFVLQRIFIADWLAFTLRHAKDHVIVCGLGETGLRLALEFQKDSAHPTRVIAIERSPHCPGIAEAERNGITVISGDAADERVLMKARVCHAKYILASSASDDTNIAIALAVQRILNDSKNTLKAAPIASECLLLVGDAALRDILNKHLTEASATKGFQLKVRGLDAPDFAARSAFLTYPLDFSGIVQGSRLYVHLLIVGSGMQAEAVAVKALQLCHYANGKKTKLTVVGEGTSELLSRIAGAHKDLDETWYDAQALPDVPLDPVLLAKEISGLALPDELLTVAVCPETGQSNIETRNLAIALEVAKKLHEQQNGEVRPSRAQVLVHLKHNAGFTALLKHLSSDRNDVKIHAFGLLETTSTSSFLLHEEQDKIARALHDAYLRENGGVSWENLPDVYRDSNRQAADHIAVKLRANGLKSVKLPYREPPKGSPWDTSASDHQDTIETLCKMEHNRYCAERFLRGWRYGLAASGDKERSKSNATLKPYADIDASEKLKDKSQILAIPESLKVAGMSIVSAHSAKDDRQTS